MEAALKAAEFQDDLSTIDTPTMGRMSKVKGKRVIISGGKPKPDWSGLIDPKPYRTPFQVREMFKVSNKDYKNRCEKINTKITKDTNLVVLGQTFLLHFEEMGMDTITYVPDPADPGNTISILTDHAKFSKEEGCKLSKALSMKFDSLDWENNAAATTVFLNSLDDKLYGKLIKNRSESDTFVTMWLRFVDALYPHSISTFTDYKEVVKNRRPTDYSGQDIEELCSDFENDAKKLSFHYDHELTMTMLETAMTAGGDSNEDFKSELRPLKKKLDQALMIIRFMDSAAKERYLEDQKLSVSHVLEEIESHYRYLKGRGKWFPAMRVTDRATPSSLVSEARSSESFANMSAAQVLALMSSFQGPSFSKGPRKKKGNCHHSGKPGHWKDTCPLLKETSNSQGQSTQKAKSWRRTAPTPGSPETINKDGRKYLYYWCQKCKRWTETYGTADHKVGFKKDDQNNNSNSYASAAAASLEVDPSVWYCPMPAFNCMDFFIELFKLWFGLFLYSQVSPLVVTLVQYMAPLVQIHKRDIFMLSLGPLLSLVLYYFISWIIPRENRKKKKGSRYHRRMYQQHVKREVRRYRRRRSRSPPPRVGRQYPLRLRQQGIYNHRSQAPTHLDQAVMNMMRDLRFELRRPQTTSVSHPNSVSGPRASRHRRRNRRRNHAHS